MQIICSRIGMCVWTKSTNRLTTNRDLYKTQSKPTANRFACHIKTQSNPIKNPVPRKYVQNVPFSPTKFNEGTLHIPCVKEWGWQDELFVAINECKQSAETKHKITQQAKLQCHKRQSFWLKDLEWKSGWSQKLSFGPSWIGVTL